MCLLLVAAACAGANRRSLFGGDLRLQVSIAPAANHNSPIEVALLIVRDGELLDELLGLSAEAWFARRDQILRDHPKAVEWWSWEWVPGQEVPPQALSFGTGARAGLVFANYATKGDHRARFDPHGDLRLVLDEEGFAVEPAAAP